MQNRFLAFAVTLVTFVSQPRNAGAQEHWVATVNIGSGCLMSGLRSIGNERSFFKECAYGALGGAFVYAGLKMVSSNPNLGPAGHLTHSLGVSIWENQIAGRAPFEEYRAFVGPFDLRYNFRTQSFRPRLLVGPVLAIGRSVVTGERFLVKESFQTMTIIFELEEFKRGVDGLHWAQGSHGTIVINPLEVFKDRGGYFDAPTTRDVLRHELVHSLQYRRFALANSLTEVAKVENKFRFFSFGQDISYLTIVFASIIALPPEHRPTEMESFAFLPASHFDFWR